MKAGLRAAVLLALALWVLAPSASAVDAAPPVRRCVTIAGETHCADAQNVPEADVGNVAAPKQEKTGPDFLAAVGGFFGSAGKAIGAAAEATREAAEAAFVAVGGLVVGALRSFAGLLASLQPEGVSTPVWAATTAGATAVAAGGTQGGLWYLLRRYGQYLLLLPGFSRIEKDELLENERRARIFELIKQNPGIHLSEIARELDFAWGTTLHHLRKLRADHLVMFKTLGHHKSFFINGSGLSEKQMEAMSLIKNGTLAQLANFLEKHPRTSLKELSEALGISPPLAAFHVRKLEKAGLVHKVREGKRVRLSTTSTLPSGFFGGIAQHVAVPPAATEPVQAS